MNFSNNDIAIENLPSIENIEFKPLEKDYLWLRLTIWGIIVFLVSTVLIIVNLFQDKIDWVYLFCVITAIILTVFGFEFKGFGIKGFAIREHDISYKSGLIFFSITSIPFNRIQHTEVSQGPVGQMFDLATVQIYTAGGATSDINVPGLKVRDAHKLKDHITQLSS